MDFKSAELLTKISVLFSLEFVLKMAKKETKIEEYLICARVTKHASKKVAKAKANLNSSSRAQMFFK